MTKILDTQRNDYLVREQGSMLPCRMSLIYRNLQNVNR